MVPVSESPPSPLSLDLPRRRATRPWIRALRWVWTLPTNLMGHAAGLVVSGSTGRPVRSPFAIARVYVIRMPGLSWVGGVTLGHAVLVHPRLASGDRGRLVLAHELAHTRQHDVLGPLYLPLHIVAQSISALWWLWRPVPGSDPVHAHNPLEQRHLFLPHRRLRALWSAGAVSRPDVRQALDALGV